MTFIFLEKYPPPKKPVIPGRDIKLYEWEKTRIKRMAMQRPSGRL